MFIFGGYDSFGVTSRVMKYDMSTKKGSVLHGVTLKTARENLVAHLIDDDKIMVCSGWNGHESVGDIDVF